MPEAQGKAEVSEAVFQAVLVTVANTLAAWALESLKTAFARRDEVDRVSGHAQEPATGTEASARAPVSLHLR